VAWPGRREVVTFTLVTLITAGFVTLFTLGLDISLKRGVLALLELR
jgi:preprotein translocase subunit SecE